jgi:RNA polymerase sigma-54 factor
MKPTLQLRLSTHLTLTPQLQQSIRLLQLSTLELSQELDLLVRDNPLLERLDDPLDSALRVASDGVLQSANLAPDLDPLASTGRETGDITRANGDEYSDYGDSFGDLGGEALNGAASEPAADNAADIRVDTNDAGDIPADASDSADWGADQVSSGIKDNSDDERELNQLGADDIDLREHLRQQLAGTRCSQRDHALVTILIDNLTDDGYLDTTFDELLAWLPAELDIDADELQTALHMLQSFEPAGVGARDHIECLLIQLNGLPQYEWPADVVHYARTIVKNHLPLLASRDYTRLRHALNCSEEELRETQALIRTLNPKPGSAFGAPNHTYVTPDVIVKKVRNQWRVTLNPDVMPKIRVNESFARMMSANRAASRSLSGQLQEARWLVKNVEQRFDTILRVSQAIVDQQKAFFTHGELAMRPLVLREIAELLGLHESTISRVTTQKYMLTPFGTLELKYFFGSHVGTETGGAASSTAIRALIKQLINAEVATKPLSDSRIAEMLGEQGFVVARRTVAKYREALDIPAVAQRKVL